MAGKPVKIECDIYRSGKNPDMYLYVIRDQGLDAVPPELVHQLGKAEFAMTLELTPDKKLARADTARVMTSLRDNGYYLQIPPRPEAYMQALNVQNNKLSGS